MNSGGENIMAFQNPSLRVHVDQLDEHINDASPDGAESADQKQASDKIKSDLFRMNVPDGGWGWFVVFGASLGHFLLVGLVRTLGFFYLAWREKYGGTAVATAWVQSLFNTCRMVTGPCVSIACDWFGSRKVVMVGGIIFCVSIVMSSFATRLIYLYLVFGLLGGCGTGMIFTPLYLMVNQYFDKRRGTAMALATVGSGLGTLILAPVENWLFQEFGYFGMTIIIGAIMLNTVITGALFRPLNSKLNKITSRILPKTSDRRSETRTMQIVSESLQQNNTKRADIVIEKMSPLTECTRTDIEGTKKSCTPTQRIHRKNKIEETTQSDVTRQVTGRMLDLLKNCTFWIYCIYISTVPCGIQNYVIYTPSLMKEKDFSNTSAVLVIAISGFFDIVGRLISGPLFDTKWVATRRWPAHCCYGLVLGLVNIANAWQSTLFGFITVAIIWGLAEGGFHGQRATIISEFMPSNQQSNSVGVMIFWQGLGNLLYPILAGYIADKAGTFVFSFLFSGMVLNFSAIVFFCNFIIVRRSRSMQLGKP